MKKVLFYNTHFKNGSNMLILGMFIPLLRACNNLLLYNLTTLLYLYFKDNSAVEPKGCSVL